MLRLHDIRHRFEGAATTFDEGDFTRLSAEQIEREMARLALPGGAAD